MMCLSQRSVATFCLAMLSTFTVSSGQRFLRDVGQTDAMVRAEMQLDEGAEGLSGMSREMYLMKDLDWELLPSDLDGVSGSIRRHVMKYMKDPVKLSLQKKQGKYGMRAIGKTVDGQKLRAYWRQCPPGTIEKLKSSELLEAPYDVAVRSRLSMVEFEVQLPPMKKGSKKLPSVVYSVAIEPGTMNPKSIIPRGAGKIRIYPEGKEGKPLEAGPGNIGLSMKAGLVDPLWAKGRPVFRKGRPTGII